jgi:hypothetical protein
MHGDFSRDTFDPTRHMSRVLYQQGRVLLDADPNEQTSILLHYLRSLARDIIGPHGMPGGAAGFALELKEVNGERVLSIGGGHYYVDGILCENDEEGLTYTTQRDFPGAEIEDLDDFPFLAFLYVSERFVPSWAVSGIGEAALGGIDTAARARVVWQVRIFRLEAGATCDALGANWDTYIKAGRGRLRARIAPVEEDDDPCTAEAGSAYRGLENQLYRVEVHTGGRITGVPTFKWSRDNGSIVFPIRSLAKREAVLESLGEDATRTLRVGDWVEVLDERRMLRGQPGIMARIDRINAQARKVTLAPAGDPNDLPQYDLGDQSHPMLRRWDYHGDVEDDGALAIGAGGWHQLEDGLEVEFLSDAATSFRTGDYWLIPARVATRDIIWPRKAGSVDPEEREPHGVQHHYAPLGIFQALGQPASDCRRCLNLAAALGPCG